MGNRTADAVAKVLSAVNAVPDNTVKAFDDLRKKQRAIARWIARASAEADRQDADPLPQRKKRGRAAGSEPGEPTAPDAGGCSHALVPHSGGLRCTN